MAVWKQISVDDLHRNINDLDMRKMYRAGAIMEDRTYPALEVERSHDSVTVLARLEIGFEEYIEFDEEHYDDIPYLSA